MRLNTPHGTLEIRPLRNAAPSRSLDDMLADGIARHRAGALGEAAAVYRAVLEQAPGNADALHLLGLVRHHQGGHDEALKLLRTALARRPDAPVIESNLGEVLRTLGVLDEAIEHFRRAIELDPEHAEAHTNLGVALVQAERPSEARACFARAVNCRTPFAPAHNNHANMLAEIGDLAGAAAHFRKAIEINPNFSRAYSHLALVDPQTGDLPVIEARLATTEPRSEAASHYHGALARILDEAGEHERAFEHYIESNGGHRTRIDYDADQTSRLVDRTIEAFPADWWPAFDPGSDGETRPVFIVGMPRSGTTLVEQILSSHPQVFGAGELTALERVSLELAGTGTDALDAPALIRASTAGDREQARSTYLERLTRDAGEAARITDKMPSNFLRLGTARMLFPHARIIHCRRDSRDTCVSGFCTQFKDLRSNAFAFDLAEIGRYYRDYARLMDHWRSLFADDWLEVDYEALIDDQERVSRTMLDYLGLDWDPRCLDFTRNPRRVTTASAAQVRKPIYGSSVQRWRRYATHLGPLFEALENVTPEHPQ